MLKYLIIAVVCIGALWGYKNYYPTVDSSSLSIAEKIEAYGSIKASDVLTQSKKLVTFVCNDEVVLQSWGSSVESCFDRVVNFEAMCEKRIFPNKEKAITNAKEARALISRYNKCVIPG